MLDRPWNLVFLAGFAVYVAIRHVYSARTRQEEKVERRIDVPEKVLLAIVMVGNLLLPLLYVFTPWLAFADYRQPEWAPWAGVAVMALALWLFWRSHADLGPNWSITLELRRGHALVTGGVYRRIRHPMYLAIWLFGTAQALLLASWLAGFSALATFAPLYLVRTPREERMMLDAFGADYRAYQARTGRLLPPLGGHG